MTSVSKRRALHLTLLTLMAFFVLCAAVGLSMYFVCKILKLDTSYLMIPVFGALGGLAGSLIRNDNHLLLVRFEPDDGRLRLGFVGDMVLGLGGSSAVVFLLGSTLNFNASKPETYPLMVSIAVLAGIFGQPVIDRAGQQLLAEKADKKATTAIRKIEQLQQSASSSFSAYLVYSSTQMCDAGEYDGAMTAAEEALRQEPSSLTATVAKARVLKRTGKVAEALALTEARLKNRLDTDTDGQRAALLYNIACYKLLLSVITPEEALNLVRQSFELDPSLWQTAPKDEDLKPIWGHLESLQLTGQDSDVQGS